MLRPFHSISSECAWLPVSALQHPGGVVWASHAPVGSELAREAVARGYYVEPLEKIDYDEDTGQMIITHDDRTVVVDFPCTHGADVPVASSLSACQQMDINRELQVSAAHSPNFRNSGVLTPPAAAQLVGQQCLSDSDVSARRSA